MSFRLSKIDEISISDHHHLDSNDECWYFGEYTAYKDWSFSTTNQLIKNFKKGMNLRNTPQWQHKLNAIHSVGNLLATAVGSDDLENVVFAPIPPSKTLSDGNYDPRVVKALEAAKGMLNNRLIISECISQKHNTEPDHQSNQTRLSPQERANTYNVHPERVPPNTKLVILFDDVLTTGSHYKGAEIVLKQALPNIAVRGIFIARRVHESPFENIDLSSIVKKLRKQI